MFNYTAVTDQIQHDKLKFVAKITCWLLELKKYYCCTGFFFYSIEYLMP